MRSIKSISRSRTLTNLRTPSSNAVLPYAVPSPFASVWATANLACWVMFMQSPIKTFLRATAHKSSYRLIVQSCIKRATALSIYAAQFVQQRQLVAPGNLCGSLLHKFRHPATPRQRRAQKPAVMGLRYGEENSCHACCLKISRYSRNTNSRLRRRPVTSVSTPNVTMSSISVAAVFVEAPVISIAPFTSMTGLA